MERYKFSMYKYAPESFRASINGKQIQLTTQEASTIGQVLLAKGTEACIAELKRFVRKSRNQRRQVTIGFFKANGSREYMFTRDLMAYDDDLQDKLRIYKEWKRYCLSKDCDLATHNITSGEFNPFGKNNAKTRESHDLVDITRPIKLKYEYRMEVM